MIRRPPRSTQSRSSAASDVYKRQEGKREDTASDDRYRLYVPQRTQTIQRARCTSPAQGYWRLRPAVVALAIMTTVSMLQLGLAMGLNV